MSSAEQTTDRGSRLAALFRLLLGVTLVAAVAWLEAEGHWIILSLLILANAIICAPASLLSSSCSTLRAAIGFSEPDE